MIEETLDNISNTTYNDRADEDTLMKEMRDFQNFDLNVAADFPRTPTYKAERQSQLGVWFETAEGKRSRGAKRDSTFSVDCPSPTVKFLKKP